MSGVAAPVPMVAADGPAAPADAPVAGSDAVLQRRDHEVWRQAAITAAARARRFAWRASIDRHLLDCCAIDASTEAA